MDEFLDIRLQNDTLDKYFIRTAILRALQKTLPSFQGSFLDIGCGKMPYKRFIMNHSGVNEYTGLDIEDAMSYDANVKPDYTWNGTVMPFGDQQFDCAMATEVLEHCPEPEVVMKEIYRVLKPGGILFFTVPFLWNLHEVPHDQYRYTPFSLERHFKNSGFSEIDINAHGGWNASLAQMLGLWVRRAPMSPRKRRVLSAAIRPVMKYLIKNDRKPATFMRPLMIPGLYGTVKKRDK